MRHLVKPPSSLICCRPNNLYPLWLLWTFILHCATLGPEQLLLLLGSLIGFQLHGNSSNHCYVTVSSAVRSLETHILHLFQHHYKLYGHKMFIRSLTQGLQWSIVCTAWREGEQGLFVFIYLCHNSCASFRDRPGPKYRDIPFSFPQVCCKKIPPYYNGFR